MSISRLSVTSLLTIFGILGTIVIGIIFSYSSLPQWSIYVVISSIVIMLCLLLWISPLPELIKKINDMRRRNYLAKKFFREFKQRNFVNRFKIIQSNENNYEKSNKRTFQNLISRLKQNHPDFKSLLEPESQINSLRDHFNFWLRWYGYFDEKIDFKAFSSLLEEFQNIVNEYHRICILEPSKILTKNSKIDEEIKKEWRATMEYYDFFINQYNEFGEEVNREFNEPVLGTVAPAQEL